MPPSHPASRHLHRQCGRSKALLPLPSDINEVFELFKLAILNHKVSGWAEIDQDDVLTVLESLRQLALAPAE